MRGCRSGRAGSHWGGHHDRDASAERARKSWINARQIPVHPVGRCCYCRCAWGGAGLVTSSLACSNRRMDVQRPRWWTYPIECANGHAWGPGRVRVSWRPCQCAPARAAQTRGSGHRMIACGVPGCRSVFFEPPHDSATALGQPRAPVSTCARHPESCALRAERAGERARIAGARRVAGDAAVALREIADRGAGCPRSRGCRRGGRGGGRSRRRGRR
jgi:hypothetical protein